MQTQQKENEGVTPGLLSAYLTREELARELKVNVRTLARWKWERKGPQCFIVGGRTLYKRSDVQAWLESLADGDK